MPIFAAVGAIGAGGAAAISAGAGLVGAGMQASAARRAAGAQTAAANQQIELQREMYEDTTRRFEPFVQGGANGFNAYLFEMGLGERPTFGGTAPSIREIPGTPATNNEPGIASRFDITNGFDFQRNPRGGNGGNGSSGASGPMRFGVNDQTFGTREEAEAFANANRTGGGEFRGFQATPGFDFQMRTGMDAIQSSAAARGGLLSGSTLQASQQFGNDLGNMEYTNYLNRLAGIGQAGQAAAGGQANAGANFATNAGNALGAIGNAQAAGAIGQGNAFAGGLNALGGAFGYLQGSGTGNGMRPQGNPIYGRA